MKRFGGIVFMRKILLIALVAVFAVAMCACSSQTINDQITDALDQAQGNLDTESSSSDLQALLDSLKEDVDASVPSESEPGDLDEGAIEEPLDGEDAVVPDDDGLETGDDYNTYTDLFEIKYVRPENDKEVFELRQVVWVNPDDTDLIEQYGLQDAEFDDDYEVVIPNEEFMEFYAYTDNTVFNVVDYETDLANKTVPCEQFIDILNETYDGTMLVECTYMGDYLFVVNQVYVP